MHVEILHTLNLSEVVGHMLTEAQDEALAANDQNEFQYELACVVTADEVTIQPIEAQDLIKALNIVQEATLTDDCRALIVSAGLIWEASIQYSESREAEYRACYVADACKETA